MDVMFRSLRSSSGGNCVMLRSGQTTLLFDCGFKSQTDCCNTLDAHAPAPDAVIVSHIHTDHINYSALRTLAKRRIPLYTHGHVIAELGRRHAFDEWTAPPVVRTYDSAPFVVGDFEIQPIQVPHDPACPTYGFVVQHESGLKAVVCTDFHNFAGVLDHFVDCDFIYVEANHDPGLLRRYPNYASRFHMSNEKTAWLLYHALTRSTRCPRHILLGHLSRQRNTPELALSAIRSVFQRQRCGMQFALDAAPPYGPSEPIQIGRGADSVPLPRMTEQLLFAV